MYVSIYKWTQRLSVCLSVCMSRMRFVTFAPIISPIGSFSSSRRRASFDTFLFPNFGPLPPPRCKNGPKRSFVQSFCSALHSQLATVATLYRWSAALIISHPTVPSLDRPTTPPLSPSTAMPPHCSLSRLHCYATAI